MGFAVVANEVKELAKETARATEDISRKVQAIQVDTQSAVTAIQEIGRVVTQISAAQNTIASAVEEQTATTNEINRNLTEAAHGSSAYSSDGSSTAPAREMNPISLRAPGPTSIIVRRRGYPIGLSNHPL